MIVLVRFNNPKRASKDISPKKEKKVFKEEKNTLVQPTEENRKSSKIH